MIFGSFEFSFDFILPLSAKRFQTYCDQFETPVGGFSGSKKVLQM